MTPGTRIAVAIVCIVAGAIGYRLGTGSQRDAIAPANEPRPDATLEASPHDATTGTTTSDSASDSGAATGGVANPAHARYRALAERASGGDRDAAAELSRWLRDCARLDTLRQSTTMYRVLLDPESREHARIVSHPGGLASLQHDLADMNGRVERVTKACENLPAADVAMRGRWLYRAAKLGDARSALEFGTGEYLVDDPWNQLADYPFWRERAEDALGEALRGGEWRAVMPLAIAYDPAPFTDFALPSFAPDPLRAYTYYSVLSMLPSARYFDTSNSLERLAGQLSPEQIEQATAAAAAICSNDLTGQCTGPAETADR